MPSKSKAQFEKMAILYKEGKITHQQFEEFNKGVDYHKLPERVTKTESSKPKTLLRRRHTKV